MWQCIAVGDDVLGDPGGVTGKSMDRRSRKQHTHTGGVTFSTYIVSTAGSAGAGASVVAVMIGTYAGTDRRMHRSGSAGGDVSLPQHGVPHHLSHKPLN